MIRYSIEPRIKNRSYIMDFCHFQEVYPTITEKKYWTLTRLDATKTASKKVVHKRAEAIGELIGNKIDKVIVKPKPISDENSRNVKEKNKKY